MARRHTWFHRAVGVITLGIVLAAAALLWLGVAVTTPPPYWAPVQTTIGGVWTVLYDSHGPDLRVVLVAIAVALLLAATVALVERVVVNRYRRTSLQVTSRPLAPRIVMRNTRGVFAGPVTVTVLIPAHDEEHSLPLTLESLTAQSRPVDRVVVVADNCTDGTVGIARAAGVEVFETVGNSEKKAGALNQALRQLLPGLGDNDLVMVMDADSRIGDGFLETAVSRFTEDRALMAVGGLFLGEQGRGLIGQFQRNEYARYQREIRRRRGMVFVLAGAPARRDGVPRAVLRPLPRHGVHQGHLRHHRGPDRGMEARHLRLGEDRGSGAIMIQAAVPTGLLFPESLMHTTIFQVLVTFVAINTIIYLVISVLKLFPIIRLPRRRDGRRRRSETRSIFPDGSA